MRTYLACGAIAAALSVAPVSQAATLTLNSAHWAATIPQFVVPNLGFITVGRIDYACGTHNPDLKATQAWVGSIGYAVKRDNGNIPKLYTATIGDPNPTNNVPVHLSLEQNKSLEAQLENPSVLLNCFVSTSGLAPTRFTDTKSQKK